MHNSSELDVVFREKVDMLGCGEIIFYNSKQTLSVLFIDDFKIAWLGIKKTLVPLYLASFTIFVPMYQPALENSRQ